MKYFLSHAWRRLFFVTVSLLVGCATLPRTGSLPTSLPTDWPARRSALQQWPGYELRGRVAVARGEDGYTATLRWAQRADSASVALEGPLGVGGVRLELLEGRLASDAQRLAAERQLGFALPLASLRYWMLGVPDPTRDFAEQQDATAPRLVALQQAGWQVSFPLYAPVAGLGYELPKRIEVVGEGVRVRVLIESWGPIAASGPTASGGA